MKLGILALGKIGSIIAYGLLQTTPYKIDEICSYDYHEERVSKYKNMGIHFYTSELELYENVDIFIFCIKPQNFSLVYEKLKNAKRKPTIIVSVAAGITLENLYNNLGVKSIIRVMPNTAGKINMGVSTIAGSETTMQEDLNLVESIFQTNGQTYVVSEEQINILIPLNGSFPAFLYAYLNAFIEEAVYRGIDKLEPHIR